MSNNIHDTKINRIKLESENMIKDIQDKENINYLAYHGSLDLEKKYEYLFKTSKSLFNFIIKEHQNSSFNKEKFTEKLNQMLFLIKKIQDDEISKYDASANIGAALAKEYIPAEFLEEKK